MSVLRKYDPAEFPPLEKKMSIGEVVRQLKAEFPNLTASKVRFLEEAGLVTPERSENNNYRKFTEAHLKRLRYILLAQRDSDWTLDRIRKQLDQLDSGAVDAIICASTPQIDITPETFSGSMPARLTDSDVETHARISHDMLLRILKLRLIRPDRSGFFEPSDAQVAEAAAALLNLGLTEQMVRSMALASQKQAALISSVTAAARTSNGDLKRRADEFQRELIARVSTLNARLVNSMVLKKNL